MTTTHCISWAYPTSPAASKHGHSAHGCYIVELGGKHLAAVPTMVEAMAAVAGKGSVPDRYSQDHAIQLARRAQKRVLSDLETELLELVCTALPFVEDAEADPCYKPGVARALVKRMRKAIGQADAPVKMVTESPACAHYAKPMGKGPAA